MAYPEKARWLILVFCCMAFSCKQTENTAVKEQTAPGDSTAKAGEPPTGPERYRLIVSFVSFGEGTDLKAGDEFKAFLHDYRERTGRKVKSEEAAWGREGEVDYCFRLEELPAAEQAEFIAALKDRLSFSELVQFAENEICSNLRN